MQLLAIPLAGDYSSAVLASSMGEDGEYWFISSKNGRILVVNSFSTYGAPDSLVESGVQDYLDRRSFRLGEPMVVEAGPPPGKRSETRLAIWAMIALKPAIDAAAAMRRESASRGLS